MTTQREDRIESALIEARFYITQHLPMRTIPSKYNRAIALLARIDVALAKEVADGSKTND